MSKIIFGPDQLSIQEVEHIRKIEEKYNVDEGTIIVEALRRFIGKIKA